MRIVTVLDAPYTDVASKHLVAKVEALLSGSPFNPGDSFVKATQSAPHDWMTVALALARDLGPEFSSEDPHALAGHGDDWFGAE